MGIKQLRKKQQLKKENDELQKVLERRQSEIFGSINDDDEAVEAFAGAGAADEAVDEKDISTIIPHAASDTACDSYIPLREEIEQEKKELLSKKQEMLPEDEEKLHKKKKNNKQTRSTNDSDANEKPTTGGRADEKTS